MKKAVTAAVAVAALATPVANAAGIATKKAVAAKPKKRVISVKKKVVGVQGFAGRWGFVEVTLLVKKTTTIVGKKKTVRRAVIGLDVPIYPDHTDRSVFINQQALPLLEQEALNVHYVAAHVDMISGATDTSGGFIDSLQSALLKAKKV